MHIQFLLLLVFAVATAAIDVDGVPPPYRDPSVPLEQRLDDLIGRMTQEEMVGQMCQYVGFGHLASNESVAHRIPENDDSTAAYPAVTYGEIRRRIRAGEIGSFLLVVDATEADQIQAAAAGSRLGIPVLFGIDAIHGHGFGRGATIYPTPLNLAATFDPALVETISTQVAAEIRAEGLHWTFAPNVDVARDPRWGRVGETFGEDPLLVGRMGAASVRGFRAGGVLTCLKHLIAGAEPANGLNAAPMDVSPRTLRAVHWPPFEAGVTAGAGTVMLAHHALNGVPCHANAALVDELRGRVGFDGFVVSDWTDVSRLASLHRVAADFSEAARLALEAGLDMHMHGPGFFEAVLALVREELISETRIETSARRILRTKFALGLFEGARAAAGLSTEARSVHAATALDAARRSLVLLKNERGILPLDEASSKRVLLTGPLADNPALLGDWVTAQPPDAVTTIREGMAMLPVFADDRLVFADVGSDPRAMSDEAMNAAAIAARNADVVVVAVGESAYRGHAWRTSGENRDRASLGLPGRQEELLRKLSATDTPLVVVLVQSRPLAIEWATAHADAILVAGEPGAMGGRAVAEVLAGVVNPSGRLAMSTPRSARHLPIFYNHEHASYWRNYAAEVTSPLYSFGAGSSYTEFVYRDLEIPARVEVGSTIRGTVTVANSGGRAGDEIVLVFVNDEIGSVTRPVSELKAFQRVALRPGESRRVEFEISVDALALVDAALSRVVEPDWFGISVGGLAARVEVAAKGER